MATLLIPTDTSQATLGYLLADGTIVGSTSQAQDFGSNGIKADSIVSSSGSFVLIDDRLRVVHTLTGAGTQQALLLESRFELSAGFATARGWDISVTAASTNSILNLTGATMQWSVSSSQTAAITNADGFIILAATQAGSIFPTNATGLTVENQGLSGSVGTVVALKIASQNAGDTATYQIRELGTTGFNVLAGNTSIGTVSDPEYALDVTGSIALVEKAAADGNIATKGQIWVKTATPNQLFFTDDAGTDFQLGTVQSVALLDGSEHTDTTSSAVTRGDLIVGNSTPAWDDLAIGTAGFFLKSDGTDPAWTNILLDNEKIVFGTGSDVSMAFNGSRFNIETPTGTGGAFFNNFVGISTASAANIILRVADAFPTATASPMVGIRTDPTARPTSGSSYDVTGVFGISIWAGTGTSSGDSCRALDFTARQNSDRALNNLTGAHVLLQTLAGKTGTLQDAFGFVVMKSYAGVAPTNEVIGMDIQDISDSGLATFKGLRLAAQTAATTNIAISQEDTAAENRLGANTSIGADAAPTSTVDINGSLAAATIAKTGDYTATIDDYFIDCDASGGAFTVTLPAASGAPRRMYRIKKTDSSGNAVTVDGNSSETIDGATTQVINVQYDSMAIICDGSNWHII